MSCISRTKHLLQRVLRRQRVEEDLDAEVNAYFEILVERGMTRGLSREEAHRAARLRFGGTEQVKQRVQEARSGLALETTLQELRYAFRGIRKSPGFAAVAILSLATGIGASTAIFSLINGVLLQPLAYEDPERVFAAGEVTADSRGQGVNLVNPVHARAWAKQCPSLEHVALIRTGSVQVTSGGEPASLRSVAVSYNLFTLFGVEPILGRTFLAEEEQAGNDRVVILAEGFWRSRFNGDPSLVGQSILVDDEPHEVIGIVPASFRVPYPYVRFEVFRPLVLSPEEMARRNGNYNYGAVVRVRPGATVQQAVAEVNVVQAGFREPTGFSVNLGAALIPVHEFVAGDARLGLWMLAAGVGAVLLIACVNLANLLLARMVSRGREAAIRTALGASRARQFSQVLTESLLLSVFGGTLGLVVAYWTLQLLVGISSLDIPRLDEVRLDANVLLFAFLLTVLTGVLFGVLPAWRLTRQDPQAALRAGSHTVTESRGGLRLREALVSLEVGMSAALLIVAALLTSSLTRLLHVDKGFDVDHVLTIDIDLDGSRYAEPINRRLFFDRLLAYVSTIPGVQAAGVVTQLPTLGQTWNDPIALEGAPREQYHVVDNRYASPGYFRAMNIALRDGRLFEERDRGHGVAVLSEKAVQLLWPGDPNPVGRSFMGEDIKVTLVGIVADVRASLESDPPSMAYYPYWQRPPDDVALTVRTTVDPHATAGALRTALRREDAQLPIQPVRTMEELVNGSVAQRRFQVMLMLTFAASALLVASLGIYGVISYSVARRRNEVGIRMALGAQRSGLLWLVIRQGMAPVVVGLAAGVAVALILGRAIRGLLFEVQPTDPSTIVGVMLALLGVGALACLIPARRAAGTDAVVALRSE